MNRNDQQYAVQRIRAAYVEKTPSALDELRELDARVRRPANVFSYVFGSISALIMGAGMSLVMTDIGTVIGTKNGLAVGIAVGVVGMIMAIVNYPIHEGMMKARKKKYAPEILKMSEEIEKSYN